MSNYFASLETLYDEKNVPYNGVFNNIDFRIYESYYKSYKILADEQYRPDKIAWKLLGSQDFSWILDLINNFENGIKEYEQNKIIKYLDMQFLINMGVI